VRDTLALLDSVQRLADSGRHAAIVELVGSLSNEEVEQSPTLALLLGIAQARLGRNSEGERWLEVAVERSRLRGDRTIQPRALNVSGAMALAVGRIEDATACFTRALAEAARANDRATIGRASNNIGIIANLRGQHGRAIGSYTTAMAAFQQVGNRDGVGMALHNLAITYRDQGDLTQALETANQAVEEAVAAGDQALMALALGGRAEIRLEAGDTLLARKETEQALARHREVQDVVGEAEDLRVLGRVLEASGEEDEAVGVLENVIARAEELRRPLLAALAERDLARLQHRRGLNGEAGDLARRARARFQQMGAEREVWKLDDLISRLSGRTGGRADRRADPPPNGPVRRSLGGSPGAPSAPPG
jgi:tetratricopeptide (TPR) repeat protein